MCLKYNSTLRNYACKSMPTIIISYFNHGRQNCMRSGYRIDEFGDGDLSGLVIFKL